MTAMPSSEPMMLVARSLESALADMSAALRPVAKCCVSAAPVAPALMPTMARDTLPREASNMKHPGTNGEARSRAMAVCKATSGDGGMRQKTVGRKSKAVCTVCTAGDGAWVKGVRPANERWLLCSTYHLVNQGGKSILTSAKHHASGVHCTGVQ